MIFFLPLGFILGAVAIIFILQNNTVVSLAFFGTQLDTSLALVVLLSILAGVLFTTLISIPGVIGNIMRIESLKKENRKLREYADSVGSVVVAPGETVRVVEETTVRTV